MFGIWNNNKIKFHPIKWTLLRNETKPTAAVAVVAAVTATTAPQPMCYELFEPSFRLSYIYSNFHCFRTCLTCKVIVISVQWTNSRIIISPSTGAVLNELYVLNFHLTYYMNFGKNESNGCDIIPKAMSHIFPFFVRRISNPKTNTRFPTKQLNIFEVCSIWSMLNAWQHASRVSFAFLCMIFFFFVTKMCEMRLTICHYHWYSRQYDFARNTHLKSNSQSGFSIYYFFSVRRCHRRLRRGRHRYRPICICCANV